MKIKSSFKDYYDHVPHLYGSGGDPKILYCRHRIKEIDPKTGYDFPFSPNSSKQYSYIVPEQQYIDGVVYGFGILIVGGRPFPLIRRAKAEWNHNNYYSDVWEHELDKFVVLSDQINIDESIFPYYVRNFIKNRKIVSGEIPEISELYKNLSKEIGHPVFVIVKDYGGSISRKCPNLGKMGMASIYEAEKLYQDLAYFVGNLMNDSPDLAPPVDISDKDRIVQHGFDLKQSFRHRK